MKKYYYMFLMAYLCSFTAADSQDIAPIDHEQISNVQQVIQQAVSKAYEEGVEKGIERTAPSFLQKVADSVGTIKNLIIFGSSASLVLGSLIAWKKWIATHGDLERTKENMERNTVNELDSCNQQHREQFEKLGTAVDQVQSNVQHLEKQYNAFIYEQGESFAFHGQKLDEMQQQINNVDQNVTQHLETQQAKVADILRESQKEQLERLKKVYGTLHTMQEESTQHRQAVTDSLKDANQQFIQTVRTLSQQQEHYKKQHDEQTTTLSTTIETIGREQGEIVAQLSILEEKLRQLTDQNEDDRNTQKIKKLEHDINRLQETLAVGNQKLDTLERSFDQTNQNLTSIQNDIKMLRTTLATGSNQSRAGSPALDWYKNQ